MQDETIRTNRLSFLIHPACWAMYQAPAQYYLDSGGTAEGWEYLCERERETNRLQKEWMDRMGPDEAMVIYPIGKSDAMTDLLDHAERVLGRRHVVVDPKFTGEPKCLYDMDEPIRHFLEDEDLPDREEFLQYLPEGTRNDFLDEIRRACQVHGYSWNPGSLKVVGGNRIFAAELARLLDENGLTYDPTTLTAEAFGEGFEQCAMTWKSMIPHYLGWSNPIENIYDKSVTGATILVDATCRERLVVRDDVRLFLSETPAGAPVGMLTRARNRFTDPQRWARIPLDGVDLTIWPESHTGKLYPAEDPPFDEKDGCLVTPVFAGSRRAEDTCCYVTAANRTYEELRDMLLNVEIDCDAE